MAAQLKFTGSADINQVGGVKSTITLRSRQHVQRCTGGREERILCRNGEKAAKAEVSLCGGTGVQSSLRKDGFLTCIPANTAARTLISQPPSRPFLEELLLFQAHPFIRACSSPRLLHGLHVLSLFLGSTSLTSLSLLQISLICKHTIIPLS